MHMEDDRACFKKNTEMKGVFHVETGEKLIKMKILFDVMS